MKIGKIAINTSTFGQFSDEPLSKLLDYGFDLKNNGTGRRLNEKENIEQLTDCIGVIAGTELYNKTVINNVKKLRIISRLGVGIDNIDLKAIQNNNIELLRTQSSPRIAVAELAVGLIIDLLRKITLHSENTKSRVWSKHMGSLFSTKTLGIIGLGTIGKTLITLTEGFNLTYLYYDPYVNQYYKSKDVNIHQCSLDELLENSDIVSIHSILNKNTYGMINYKKIKMMKQNSILINTSRGEIIIEEDLNKALDENILGGVGLDVYPKEPYNGPLLDHDNIITTPHIGSYAKEIRMQMELEAVNNIIEYFKENIS